MRERTTTTHPRHLCIRIRFRVVALVFVDFHLVMYPLFSTQRFSFFHDLNHEVDRVPDIVFSILELRIRQRARRPIRTRFRLR